MDPIKAYFKDVRGIPLLTPEEEIELATRVQQGDEEARKRMIIADMMDRICVCVSFFQIVPSGNSVAKMMRTNSGTANAVKAIFVARARPPTSQTELVKPARKTKFLNLAGISGWKKSVESRMIIRMKCLYLSKPLSAEVLSNGLGILSSSSPARPMATRMKKTCGSSNRMSFE